MSYFGWKPYVPVATRRAQAEKANAKAKKAGKGYAPVTVNGRTIAKTFWGKAWCSNLEAYSDYSNRVPRGRSYVCNGSVVDLKITPGKVLAKVMGSRLYTVEIDVAAVPAQRWKALAKDCTRSIDSLVALLQGTFSQPMMQRLCQPDTGLFPAPKQIRFNCSCPDSAAMCKHIAATLYGVGARLDGQPELLFTLRQVDAAELVNQAAVLPVNVGQRPTKARAIEEAALSELFGIELGEAAGGPVAASKKTRAATGKPTSPKPAAAKKAAVKKAVMKKPAVKKASTKKAAFKKAALKKATSKKTATTAYAVRPKKSSPAVAAAKKAALKKAVSKKAVSKKTVSKKAALTTSMKTVHAVRSAKPSPSVAKKTVRIAHAKNFRKTSMRR